MATTVPEVKLVTLTIDGVSVQVPEGTTIWDAAREAGIEIPALCHDPRYDPVGVCRMCVVDIGGRVLAASCVRACEDGMTVDTVSPRVEKQREMLTEMLMADQPEVDPKQTTTADNELLALAERYGVERENRMPGENGRPLDHSNPVIAVDHQACILCDRCVRACDDIQSNEVIGRTGKGYTTRIAFDLDDPMGNSTCVSCGECVAACPTGAITNKPITLPLRPRSQLAQVDSVCPYCGVGCALTYHVDPVERTIVFAEGRDQPGNQGRLCVKGRYGWDYAAHAAAADEAADPPRGVLPQGRAVGRGAGRQRRHAAQAQAGRPRELRRGAARLPRGDLGRGARPGGLPAAGDQGAARIGIAGRLRLGQVQQRGGVPVPEADARRLRHQQRRPLHPALPRVVGRGAARGHRLGAVSTTYGDIEHADVAILTGSNTTANHPVAATFFKGARKRGTTIIVVDPRGRRSPTSPTSTAGSSPAPTWRSTTRSCTC